MLATMQKTCLRCGDVKDGTEFHRDRSKRDGLVPYCKSCANACGPCNTSKGKKTAMEFLVWRVAIAC